MMILKKQKGIQEACNAVYKIMYIINHEGSLVKMKIRIMDEDLGQEDRTQLMCNGDLIIEVKNNTISDIYIYIW